jgi:uncharacterized protein YjbJ (UPF0337 family)
MSDTTEKIKGKVEQAQGKIQQAVGKATGDKEVHAHGHLNETKGKVREAVVDAKSAVKKGVKDIKDDLKATDRKGDR